MLNIYPSETLGYADHGWLKARHHFSFADYHNPDRMEFGALRVINDDTIQAGRGFDMHPHKDMEIITFVRSGAITHRDSRGNEGRTEAGNVQVMSAGKGIYHSEFNLESTATTLFQIWIYPKEKHIEPRWDSAVFEKKTEGKTLPLLVSGRAEDQGKGALYIHQEASIYGGTLEKNQEIIQPIKDQAYILISEGEIELDGLKLKKGDGAEVIDQKEIKLRALTEAQILMIDIPA